MSHASVDRLPARPPRLGLVLAALLPLPAGDPPPTVRVNHVLAPGESVSLWAIDEREQRIVYGVDHLDLRSQQLFSARWDGSQGLRTLTDLLPPGRQIQAWDLHSRTRRVVFSADLDTDEVLELYSVSTAGDRVPVKLSAALDPGVAVLTQTRTPDDRRVLYLAGVPYSGNNALYSVPADGSEPARALFFPGTAGEAANDLRISADSRRVVGRASRPAVKLNGPLPQGGNVVLVQAAADGRRVFHAVWTSTSREVFTSVIPDGTAARRARGTPR